MGDVKGNLLVEIARQKMSISNVQATIARQQFENVEMTDRRERNDLTIKESGKLLGEMNEKLAKMETLQAGRLAGKGEGGS